MEINPWLSLYEKTNNSYHKKVVFRFGFEAGFFSEYNNMVLAAAYCLQHKIKFTLCSEFSYLTYEKGWSDYFLPFCEENNERYNKRNNVRKYRVLQDFAKPLDFKKWVLRERLVRLSIIYGAKYQKLKYGVDYFTQDIWDGFRNKKFAHTRFTLPEVGFNKSTLLEVVQKIIQSIWRFSPEAENFIRPCIAALGLPNDYVGLHIRAGDKATETDTYGVGKYMDIATKVSTSKNAYVLTDDYNVILELENKYPEWTFYTMCQPAENGYIHGELLKKDKRNRYELHLKLLASMEIFMNGQKFIGSYSSNPGMFMGMAKGEDFCHCVDFERWQLW